MEYIERTYKVRKTSMVNQKENLDSISGYYLPYTVLFIWET